MVIIDEAHRGAKPNEIGTQMSIMQKFVLGSEADNMPSMPLVIGMSATLERFNELVKSADSTLLPMIGVYFLLDCIKKVRLSLESRTLKFLSYFWEKWVVMDSNHRRHSQQIYSLPHLATLVTTQKLYVSKASAKVMLLFDITKFFRHFFLFSFKKCSFSPIK